MDTYYKDNAMPVIKRKAKPKHNT